METRTFGKTDMKVGVLGFGGSEIGFSKSITQAEVDQLLNSALDAGLNVIDTAECYMDSEEKIGRAISHRRDEFYLFTKTGHASGFEEKDWDPQMMAKQVDRSLERLKTDHVDLIHLHTCSSELLKQGDVIDILRRAKEAGKTRYIGYSGDNEAAEYAIECGAFDSVQVSCNIADQLSAETTIPAAREKGMGIVAKRPVANFSWTKGSKPDYYGHSYWERLQVLSYPFLDGGQEEAFAITLGFALAQPGVCTAIVGTANPERFEQNLRALHARPISPDEVEKIRARWQELRKADWHSES